MKKEHILKQKQQGSKLSSNFLPSKYREYLGLGVEIAAIIILPLIAGYLFDTYMGSSPWGLLVGAFIGIVFFFFSIFRIAKKLDNNSKG